MYMNGEPDSERPHEMLFVFIRVAALLFVIYPLGMGPVATLSYYHPSARKFVAPLYCPINFATNRVSIVDRFYAWYFQFWYPQ